MARTRPLAPRLVAALRFVAARVRAPALRAALVGLAAAFAFAPAVAQQPAGDPTRGETGLVAGGGFDASLVYAGDAGVWTCGAAKIFPRFGQPTVYGLDDRGRLLLCVGYSGAWTPVKAVEDREWLGAFAHADVDPRRAGPEIYTGGRSGRLWQVSPADDLAADATVVARFPGREIHTATPVRRKPDAPLELLVFLDDGATYLLRPEGPGREFVATETRRMPGRVRDVATLPGPGATRFVAACRAGQVLRASFVDGELRAEAIVDEPMGFGRVALRPGGAPGAATVYATRDDGVVVRLAERADGGFDREVVYAGAQGLRGVAAGRFDADPNVETLAIAGYGAEVKLLRREPNGRFSAATLFVDSDRAHWLATAELDGRNATDELLVSGYAGRIVLLARPGGYGLPGVLAEPGRDARGSGPARAAVADATPAAAPPPPAGVRIAVRADGPPDQLSPLRYGGGFETKTFLYETLVTRDDQGRTAPGLAVAWERADGGRTWTFRLRPNAGFHDGAPVDAAAVRQHFLRWAGLPEHGWLGTSRLLREVVAEAPDRLVLRLAEPWPVPEELCVVNPCAIQGPGSLAADGAFRRPIGSGPWRFAGALDDGRVLRLEGATPERGPLSLRRFPAHDDVGPVAALLRGEIDLLADGWSREVPREKVEAFRQDPRFRVTASPGSAVVYLAFKLVDGPTADPAVRRAVVRATRDPELARAATLGFARPCSSLFGPELAAWPEATDDAASEPARAPAVPLVFAADLADGMAKRAADAVVAALGRAGIPVRLVGRDVDPATWDLRLEESWGLPYDPFVTLRTLFRSRLPGRTAVNATPVAAEPALDALVDAATAAADDDARLAAYRAIENHVRRRALVAPLYTPDRVAVATDATPAFRLPRDLYRIAFER